MVTRAFTPWLLAAKVDSVEQPAPVSIKNNLQQANAAGDQEQELEAFYKRISPAVVNITVSLTQNLQDPSQGGMAKGSDFLYDTKGQIITNNHVVDGVTQIEVNFPDGTVEEANVLGVDPDSDLAIIQIESMPVGA